MNPVFEHYMTEQAQQALNVFRTFNKEDFIDEFIDPDHSLIEEAFNDVETLLNYSNVIGKNNNISMEECGFIASHINSIERKYKGIVDFNIVASESQEPDFRATLVSEALGKGAIYMIIAVITAIISLIVSMMSNKTNNTSARISSNSIDIAKLEKSIKEMEHDNKITDALKEFSFITNSKFVQNYYSYWRQKADPKLLKGVDMSLPLSEYDYKKMFENYKTSNQEAVKFLNELKNSARIVGNYSLSLVKLIEKNLKTPGKTKELIDKSVSDLYESLGFKQKDFNNLWAVLATFGVGAYYTVQSKSLELEPVLIDIADHNGEMAEQCVSFKLVSSVDLDARKVKKNEVKCGFAYKELKGFNDGLEKDLKDKKIPWSDSEHVYSEIMGLPALKNFLSEASKTLEHIEGLQLTNEYKIIKNHYILDIRKLIDSLTNMVRFIAFIYKTLKKQQDYAIAFVKELVSESSKAIKHIESKGIKV